ncbi:DsbA family protein [Hymenobacter latericus]|uniref:DsbA family protein n=1 Tax=Hymenobacter sp. YIM 151858-1 TaxID=2987688 RepID=UPI002225E752|nr:DsbA family protein [Hymenobacter sp. YIM 151858-1]UYZ59135.1 DsbA family protein [Hymenobacter sp. YIM 151858-1]
MQQNQLPNTQLLYIFDPLCGWCYGMSPVVKRLAEEYAERVPFTALSGGMVVGEDVEPIGKSWSYISQALEQVERVTGVEFGNAFRELGAEGSYMNNSEPPSRALMAFKQLDPLNREVAFAHDIQHAHFAEGRDLNAPETYEQLARAYSLDAAEFRRWWESDATREATRHEFDMVRQLGVQGFPTLVLVHGHQGYVLTRGYQPYEDLKAGLEQLLGELTQQ